jgi:hypothetical protein
MASTSRRRPCTLPVHLGTANVLVSNGWINRFKRRYHTVYRNLTGECSIADAETVKLQIIARN